MFLLGNGGSAATASHMMNDLNKFTNVPGKPRFRAIALTDNVPLLTAVGNDQSYAEVFVEPLQNLLEPAMSSLLFRPRATRQTSCGRWNMPRPRARASSAFAGSPAAGWRSWPTEGHHPQ